MNEISQSSNASILVFGYKRAGHLRSCIESLALNPEACESDLIIYCDGPRTAGDRASTDEVRALVERVSGFRSITRVFRDANMGLARSIIEGVSEQLLGHDRVIVVEDDLIVSSGFLRYMNAALATYELDATVASIHGYCYPVGRALPETFFLRGADCWGWGTWGRAWATFRTDGTELLAQLEARKLISAFDLDGAYSFSGMLKDQIAGRNDSWAVRWHASCFLNGMLTLYPGRSLVHNIGNDSSGSHSRSTDTFDVALSDSGPRVQRIALEENTVARKEFVRFLAKSSWRSRLRRASFIVGALLR